MIKARQNNQIKIEFGDQRRDNLSNQLFGAIARSSLSPTNNVRDDERN
jgi:hypothetical protein